MDLSVIVPCFKRSSHLAITAPGIDLQVSQNKDSTEYIVLTQGCHATESWIDAKKNKGELSNVQLIRHRELFPIFFSSDHFNLPKARNQGARAANGEFVLHMDCDIFCNEGFVQAVLKKIMSGKMNKNSYLTIGPIPNRAGPGYNGILCLHRDTYWRLGGYDENLKNYGYHDTRFILKCIEAGLSHVWLPHDYVCHIDHEDDLRVANYPEKDISKSYTQNVERANVKA